MRKKQLHMQITRQYDFFFLTAQIYRPHFENILIFFFFITKTRNTILVWNAYFLWYLKIKSNVAAYLGTGSLVSQTPWKTETTKYLNIFCVVYHILNQLRDKAFHRIKDLYMKTNDLIEKHAQREYWINSTLGEKQKPLYGPQRLTELFQCFKVLCGLHFVNHT